MKNGAVSFFRSGSLISFGRSHRRLVSTVIVGAVLSFGAVAFAAITSGTRTAAASSQVADTTVTINKPSVSTGNLMLATIAVKGGSAAVLDSAPTGWTLIASTTNDTNVTLLSYWKAASTSEPSSYTWQFLGQTTAEGEITPYSGVDTSVNPIDAVANNIGFGTTATTTSITTSAAKEEVVALYAADVGESTNAGAYFSTPTGMTEKSDDTNTPFGPTIAADEVLQTSAGAVGSKTSTISGGKARNWASQQIALRPITIAFDAGSSGYDHTNGTSLTVSHTISGSNRILFVSVTMNQATPGQAADLVTGVTFNGVALTQLGKVATHSCCANSIETYLYYLIAPDTGTHDIVVSYSSVGNQYVFVADSSYTGASQTGVPDASAESAPNIFPSTSATGTVTTVADDDWVVMGSYSGDGNTSAGSGTTVRATSPTLDRQVLSDNGGPVDPAGSVTLTVNGNSDRVGSVTAAFAPAN
jgi:hypothetical protein